VTEEEVLAMKAGRELNTRVAEGVMGCIVAYDAFLGDMQRWIDSQGDSVWGPLERYSEDHSVAEKVVGRLESKYNARIEFNYATENWEAEFSELATGLGLGTASALDRPEAICKAALLAVLPKRA